MGKIIHLNREWTFNGVHHVEIPHTPKILDYNFFDATAFEEDMHYSRDIFVEKNYKNNKIKLHFDGVAHYSEIYLNKKRVYVNKGGYSHFEIDISDDVIFDEVNTLEVLVKASKQLNIPPFGGVIDYITYGGIYREVYMEICHEFHIEDVFCYSQIDDDITFYADVTISDLADDLTLRVLSDGDVLLTKQVTSRDISLQKVVHEVLLWDIDNPRLYHMRFVLCKHGKVIDEKEVKFGYRKAEFKSDGFYLNDKKIKLIGLNRHQSFAYAGYAMPKRVQENDVTILKDELKVNIVRTSHYPNSKHFYNKCDEIGLLVFTEIPGWQHIGDEEWKRSSLQQLKSMILDHRNHPSIITWGVRINESLDDDSFYSQTNSLARELDPTRCTTGVRFLKNSKLLEDVYSLNDFVNDGSGTFISNKGDVTDVMNPYLISEHTGHMYPTKSYDNALLRTEHAKRHFETIHEAMQSDNISGVLGWCMNDYNTNREFGSGDGICHHGVLDMFRNPKLAAYVYQCFGEDSVMELSTNFTMGDIPGGVFDKVYVITNVDKVLLYKNDEFIKSFTNYHNFIHIDDFLGENIKDQNLKKVLNAMSMYTPGKMPEDINRMKALLDKNDDELYSLYNKYIGGWGSKGLTYTLIGIKDNKEVIRKVFKREITPTLTVKCDSNTLVIGDTYDVATVRITVEDEYSNRLVYFDDVVEFEVEGDVELIGPKLTHFRGGSVATYVRTKQLETKAVLRIKCRNMVEELHFTVVKPSPSFINNRLY